jgi:V8-like Glu-specific endopeptidase
MAPAELLDGLEGLRMDRGGKETVVEVPKRLQRRLMRQQGKIGDQANKGKLKQVGNTGEYPYTTIGVVASGCTGAVVMKRFVLTAAWCVYDLKAKGFYQNLNFYPAMNGKKTPFGEIAWKSAWVHKAFSNKGDIAFPYGLIELEQEIGEQTGWLGFGDLPKGNVKQFTLTGYPFDGVPPQTMWESRCSLDAAEANALFYRCPGNGKSLATMLGAPLWLKGKSDDSWQIVGIHVTSQNDQLNSWWAARLNQAATETILSWANGGGQVDEPDENADDEEEDADEETGEDEEESGEDEEEEVSEDDTGKDDDDAGKDGPDCTCEDQDNAQ